MRCRINPDNRTELWFRFDDTPPDTEEDVHFSFEADYDDKEYDDVDIALAVAQIANALAIAFGDPIA